MLFAALAAACTTTGEAFEPTDGGGTEGRYTIDAALGDATRVDAEGVKISWNPQDTLIVYTGSNFLWSKYVQRRGEPAGTFFGTDAPQRVAGADYYIAVTGAANAMFDTKYGRDALWQTVPNEQEWNAAGLPPMAFPMIGRWTEEDARVLFKPMAAVMSIPVYAAAETTLARVELRTADASIAGLFGLETYGTLPDGYADPAIREDPEGYYLDPHGEKWVAVKGDIAVGATQETAADVRFVLLPTDLSGGFTVVVTDAEGNSMARTVGAAEDRRLLPGQLQTMAPLLYRQEAPVFRVYTSAKQSVAQGTLTAGRTYRWWLERDVVNDWGRVKRTVITEKSELTATMKYVDLTAPAFLPYLKPKEGEKVFFVISASGDDGVVYTRYTPYDYVAQPVETETDAFTVSATLSGDWLEIRTNDPEGKFTYSASDNSTGVLLGSHTDWAAADYYAGLGAAADETWDATTGVWRIHKRAFVTEPVSGMKLTVACGIDFDGNPKSVSAYTVIADGGGTETPAFRAELVSSSMMELVVRFPQLPADFPADPLTSVYVNALGAGIPWKDRNGLPVTLGGLDAAWNGADGSVSIPVPSLQETWAVGMRIAGNLVFGYGMMDGTPRMVSEVVSYNNI